MSDNKLDEILLDIIEQEERKIRRDFAEIDQDSYSRGKKALAGILSPCTMNISKTKLYLTR